MPQRLCSPTVPCPPILNIGLEAVTRFSTRRNSSKGACQNGNLGSFVWEEKFGPQKGPRLLLKRSAIRWLATSAHWRAFGSGFFVIGGKSPTPLAIPWRMFIQVSGRPVRYAKNPSGMSIESRNRREPFSHTNHGRRHALRDTGLLLTS